RELGIPVLVFDKLSMTPWRFFLRLSALIRKVAPDIVHTWLYSANFWGRWAALQHGVPCLIASDRSILPRRNIGRRLVERISETFLAPRTARLANSIAVARSLE